MSIIDHGKPAVHEAAHFKDSKFPPVVTAIQSI